MTEPPHDPFSTRTGPAPSDSAPTGRPAADGPQSGDAPAWGSAADAGPPQTATKAVVALASAVGSFVIPLVPAIVALVLASAASRDIETSAGRVTGAGLVTAAKVLAWINVVLCVLVAAAVVLFFVLLVNFGFSEGQNPTF